MDFGSVKNVGTAVVDTIVKERKQNGEFKSFTDFCERMQGESVNKKCIESLIKAGAFDEFEQTRSTLLASFETIIDTINDTSKKTMQGQVTMFDLGKTEDEKIESMKYKFTTLKEFDEKELLSMEKEMLGIYISGHPLEKLRNSIEKVATINTLQMIQMKEQNDLSQDGKQVKYIGIINSIKKKYTKKNTLMAFITVEDLYGSTEIIVFDGCYSKAQNILLNENIVLVEGRLSIREDDDVKIVANNITEFNENSVQQSNNYNKPNVNNVGADDPIRPKMVTINITNLTEEQKAKLRGAIKFFTGDKTNIALSVNNGDTVSNKTLGGTAMKENVEKFFSLYNADAALKQRIKDAEAAYPGSLELREPLVETVLLPVARELGLEFSIRELQDYETEHYARRHRDVELTEEDLAAPDEEPEYWLIQHGWSHDDSIFCPGSQKEPGLIRIEKRK